MYNTLETLTADCCYQRNLLERLKKELVNLPEGGLVLRNKGGRDYIYIRHYNNRSLDIDSENKKEHTLSPQKITERSLNCKDSALSKKDLKMAIKRRRFIEKSIPILEKNIKILEICIKNYTVFDEGNIYASLGKAYDSIPLIQSNEVSADGKIWSELQSNRNEFNVKNLKHTVGSDKVRSKSEAIIITLLKKYNIPYKYEVSLELGRLRYFPDFVILNPIDKHLVFWEHFGLTNDDSYLESMDKKLATYRINGITLWNNLLITFDEPNGSVDVLKLERLIKCFFVADSK